MPAKYKTKKIRIDKKMAPGHFPKIVDGFCFGRHYTGYCPELHDPPE
jgi:hypothetical protein